MPRTGRPKAPLALDADERAALTAAANDRGVGHGERARIVLGCAEGLSNREVAAREGVSVATVGKWRGRFVRDRLAGLADEARTGRPPAPTPAQAAEPPPAHDGELGPDHDGRLTPVRDAARMLTAAYLYYIDDQSQDAIGRRLGVSRSTVSRLLAEARETGVVRIEVRAGPTDAAIQERLATQLGLRQVYTAPGIADESDPGPLLSTGVAQALRDCALAPGDAMVVSWGRAPWSVAQLDLPRLGEIDVLPAIAGFSDDSPWFQTNEIVRRVAASVGGRARLLHAPSLPSPALRRSLLRDPEISSVLSRWDDASVLIAGIGAWPKRDRNAAPAALAPDGRAPEPAIADVCSRYFDGAGRTVPGPAEDRLLAISREQILRIERRIGVAVGIGKCDAIIAAARAGLVNVLVTDLVTASALASRLAADAGS